MTGKPRVKQYWVHPSNAHELGRTDAQPMGCVIVYSFDDYKRLERALEAADGLAKHGRTFHASVSEHATGAFAAQDDFQDALDAYLAARKDVPNE